VADQIILSLHLLSFFDESWKRVINIEMKASMLSLISKINTLKKRGGEEIVFLAFFCLWNGCTMSINVSL